MKKKKNVAFPGNLRILDKQRPLNKSMHSIANHEARATEKYLSHRLSNYPHPPKQQQITQLTRRQNSNLSAYSKSQGSDHFRRRAAYTAREHAKYRLDSKERRARALSPVYKDARRQQKISKKNKTKKHSKNATSINTPC